MSLINKIRNLASERVKQFGAQYNAFAIFGVINYPLAYFLEALVDGHIERDNLLLRLFAFVLCLALYFFNRNSHTKYRSYLPLYWYCTVIFSIPLLTTYILLKNQFSMGWLINYNVGILIVILLFDWLSFIIVELIGILLGIIIFTTVNGVPHTLPRDGNIALFFYLFLCIVILAPIFSRNKELFNLRNLKDKDALNKALKSQVAERTYELSDALVVKTEFLNNISHEIRTPAMGVCGIANELVAQWDSLNEAKRYFYLEQIAKNSNRLTSMLGSVLDLAKATDSQMILDITNIDLNKIVEEMIDESETLYLAGKKIKFIFHSKDLPKLHGDSERIAQVVRNLFVNAIKFSPSDSVITIKVEPDGIDKVKFSISDQGIGIPEDELESIFLPFTQSSRTKTKAGGTGLGLAIIRKIIEAHGGRIWAENNKKGAIFYFEVPLKHKKETVKIVVDEKEDKQHSILIIDDEESCLFTLELLLNSPNYSVTKAESGLEGLSELASGKHFDLILLDMMMPDIYGLEFLKIIKQDEKHCQIPVIIQSGIADQSEFDKAIKLGACGYIKKPYQRNILLESISRVLAG